MTVDYPGAIDMLITDPAWVFTDALEGVPNADKTIVIHKTATPGANARDVANYFIHDVTERKSAHFIVDLDGSTVQVVLLKDGAGANCCLEPGHEAYWDALNARYSWNGASNLNVCTISIEHIDQTTDNSQIMPQAQIDASFKLIKWLVDRYSLDPTRQIKGHNTLDPESRARCPGPTYPWSDLMTFLQVPQNVAMHQAMLDTWNMFFRSLSSLVGQTITPPPYTSGIARDWQNWYAKKNFGPPVMYEQHSVNWNGESIQVQYFLGGIRAEWNNKTGGPTVFYDSQGNIIT